MLRIGRIIGHEEDYLKIMPLTDDIERFLSLEYIYLETPIGQEKLHILDCSLDENTVFLKIEEIDSERLLLNVKNFYLVIPKKDAIALEEGRYYIYELVGLEVYDEKERFLGEIKEVIKTGSNDVYLVQNKDEEILIPALKKIVKKIDLVNKKMFVELLEGLED